MNNFDSHGWLCQDSDRQAKVNGVVIDPPAHGDAPIEGQPWPNWTGTDWVMMTYVIPHVIVVAPVISWSPFEFYRKFTAAERIAIRALAISDPVAADFMHTLDNAIASGTQVHADDVDLLAGLGYLQTHPISSPCLTADRITALLS